MSGHEGLTEIPSHLASSQRCAPAAERIDWEDFFLTHDLMIRHVVAHYAARRADVDDLHQEVRKELARKLPGFRLDPMRGTLRGWVATLARRVAAK